MAQKRIKRTDQEWFDLIKDCKTSSLKVKIWCEQHGITEKAIDYHSRRLRQKGYTIPRKIHQAIPYEKQEVICLDMESLQTPKAAEMLFRIAEEIGISDEGLFAVEALLLESVRMVAGHRRGYYGNYYSSHNFSGVDLVRPFLSVEDHRKLFWILERHTFLNYPDQYLPFLTGVLSKEDHLLWFPKEDARKVFLAISETGRKKGMENLRKIYLTEDELEELKLKRQEKEKRRLLLEQRRRKEAIRKDFDWRVAKSRGTDTQFAELYDYVERYCREREEKKEKRYITKRYLCSLFQRNPCMLLEREEAGSLCKLLRFLFLKEDFK